MAEGSLSSFPKNDEEFLASLWLQQQDLQGKSPTEISDMYYSALIEISKNYDEKYKSKPQPSHRRIRSPGLPRP